MTDSKIPPGYRKNKFGYLTKFAETPDPVGKASKVAFKRPLSAHQRVLQAIRTHEAIKAMNEAPGDDSFDGPDVEGMTPHQLMIDPVSGEEMTAGEHVMLQHERGVARAEIQKTAKDHAERLQREAASKKQKKLAIKPADESDDESDET